MIFDRLIIKDFGVYRGTQTFDLTPSSAERPVVLIGAFNGSGKTTFLDALQLAFYGKLASCSNRKGAYEKYLARSINHAADPEDGAGVEVHFRCLADGEEKQYQIKRFWSVRGASLKEEFSVHCNGARDTVLSDSWLEFLEEILPHRIAPLFFFDGEQIEQFADPGTSRQIMESAVHGLLGLDLVDKLEADLGVLQTRNQQQLLQEDQRQQIFSLTKEVHAAEGSLSSLFEKRKKLGDKIKAAEQDLERCQRDFDAEGGVVAKECDALKARELKLKTEHEALQVQLRAIAAENLPLVLVQDLLAEARAHSEKEDEAAKADAILEVLDERDAKLLALASKFHIEDEGFKQVEQFLVQSKKSYEQTAKVDRYLNLSKEGHQNLCAMDAEHLDDTCQKAQSAIERLDEIQEALVAVGRKLSSIPADEIIEAFLHRIRNAEKVLEDLQRAYRELEDRIREEERTVAAKRKELSQMYEQYAGSIIDSEDRNRIIEHAERVKSYLTDFKQRMLSHRVSAIEEEVGRCIQRLFRKDTLISKVQIDAKDLSMVLRGGDYRPIEASQLSAGERQLLALGILWALANLSGRPAPVVVDTPLGRLDSRHRHQLVEAYFPNASHQVIILSTDEEIDRRFYAHIQPHMSHCYRIEYDPQANGSRVVQGYFFEEAA